MRYSIRRPLSAAVATVVSIGGLASLAPTTSAAGGAVAQTAVADGPRQRVIVTLDEPAALRQLGGSSQSIDATNRAALRTLDQTREELRADQRDLLAAARDAGADVRQLYAFTDLVDAVALTVPSGDLDELRRLDGVRAVFPDSPMRSSTDVSVPLIGATEVWERTDADGQQVRGDGVTVAILDTGIDYNLDDLGGGFGADFKVVDGYDFANGDDDPMDGNGHGTHVAGIVAGDGGPDGITGVAPGASLTAYKVLHDDGSGYESDIIAGIEAAVAPDNPHRADVINMSLGGVGDGTEPIGQAATAATQEGVVVVASAGNSGPAAGTVGTPAAADGVISVGASVSGVRVPVAYVESPQHELLQAYRAAYSANPPEEPVTAELVDVGRGTDTDYERVGDVTGKIVAIQSTIPGSIEQTSPFYLEQARRAEERGAVGLIGYIRNSGGPVLAADGPKAERNDGDGLADVPLLTAASGDSFRMDEIVVLGVDALQWQELAGFLADGPVEISISGQDLTDRVAAFSSQGPTQRYTLEPDLVAPGVEIRSTWPSAQWAPGEFRISGTSMASPHVAGAAALLRQLRPDDSAADTAGALIGSAKALDDVGPTVQGAGRLDVDAAASAVVTSRPTSISLGLADLSRDTVDGSGSVRLVNHSDEAVDVTISGQTAPGSPGRVTVSPTSATIPAGGSVSVSVRVAADRPATDTEVAGWVTASVPDGPDVRVPYLLSVRPLIVQSSPDPSDGTSAAFVYSPTALSGPPVLTVTSPSGSTTAVDMTLDHGSWYRARVTGSKAGVYRLDARAWTTTGRRLVGSGALEVLAKDNRPGGDRWQPIGPNGEAGDIATTAGDPDTAVVTQYTKAGPWITTDGGSRWRQVDRLPVAGGDGTVIVDAADSDRMWYAVNGEAGNYIKVLLDPTYQGKVLRTDDGGRTWQTLDFPDAHVSAFVSDPATRVLVAVTDDAIVVSRDGGRTWSSHASPISGEELLDASIGGPDLYLGGFSGVWAVRGILDGVPDGSEQVYDAGDVTLRGMIADGELVAALNSDNLLVGSRDGGSTWETVHEFPRFGPWSIAMRKGTIVVGTYQADNYVSRDHGVTWANVPRPLRGPVEVDFTPWHNGSLLYASENGGLFRTEADGANPTRLGVPGVSAYDVAVSAGSDGRPVLLAGTDSDVYRTPLPTAANVPPSVSEWGLSGYEGYTGTTVHVVESSPSEPGVVWKIRLDATGSFWIYRSADGGATWEVRGRDRQVAYDLGVSPVDPQRVVVPFGNLNGVGLFATRDGGATWKKLFHDQVFSTVAMDPTDPDRLWLGSSSGLYRSDDFGQTVTKVASGRVLSIVVKGDRIVAGGDRILVSADGGETFRAADAGGLSMLVKDVVAGSNGTWYAGTTAYTANGLVKGGRGVLRSTDGGLTWVNVSGGLQNLSVQSLAVSGDRRWLFAGTDQGGVHRLRIG
ncbi:MAG TPA: S8 family serine peptidase [Nocardioidaceae bacterium]|nr:S8 family serine peptidase [Nocardioidaceae bacterium]